MKTLEMLDIRITEHDYDIVEVILKQLIEQIQNDKNQNIKVYNKLSLDTDFTIHLIHPGQNIDTQGSDLGQYLASTLKRYGLVNHSVWIEMKTNEID